MKRLLHHLDFFVRLFLVVLAFAFASSFAETEPKAEAENPMIREIFAGYTDQDLLNLLTCVNYEMECRGLSASNTTSQKEVTVPAGKYTIGSDVPSGIYTLTTTGYISMFTVWNSSGGLVTMHTLSEEANVGKIELTDGQVIEINGSSIVFKPYAGLGF